MAVEDGGSADPSPSQSGYTPVDPGDPTLAGSVYSACVSDVPWINYDITLVDPDAAAAGGSATLVMTNGTESVSVPLGQLEGNHVSGAVLWPGAKVVDGVAAGWPGWALEGGAWVETSGNYAWTKGNISAYVKVNPELAVKLSYPPTTPACAPEPRSTTELGLSLAATGMNSVVLPIGIAAGAVMLIGVTFLVVQRRRSRA